MAIDYTFTESRESAPEGLKSEEGSTHGYLPAFGDSGFTIGWGVDISHYTVEQMREWGVSEEDLKVLERYSMKKKDLGGGSWKYVLGPQGTAIADRNSSYLDIYLREDGKRSGYAKEISLTSLKALNTGVREKFEKEAKIGYESLSGKKWDKLTNAQQTVLYDIAYSSGGDFISGKTRKLKQHVSDNNWNLIEQELQSGMWDPMDVSRRRLQSSLLNSEKDTKSYNEFNQTTEIDSIRIPQ